MKILLAIDGSESSKSAINELNNFRNDQDLEIIILGVVERVGPMMAEPFGGAMIEYEAEIEKQKLAATTEIVTKAREKIEREFGYRAKAEAIMGSPKYVIVEKSEEYNADLIILGSHGYRLWERVLLGSVSGFVATHAGCSVLISRRRSHD